MQNRKSAEFELIGMRSVGDEKVMTMGLVSNLVDSFNTIISPEGCLTPIHSVPVDYNHNRTATEAYMVDLGMRDLPMPNGKGGTENAKVRVVEVHVPKNARAYEVSNRQMPPEQVPSLYDYVSRGRVRWGSVDFSPRTDKIEKVYNADGKLIREVYPEWSLNYFSLLDKKPAQETSYTLNIRSLDENMTNRSQVESKIRNMLEGQGKKVDTITGININMLSDNEGTIRFYLDKDTTKPIQVGYTQDNTGDITLANDMKELTPEVAHAENSQNSVRDMAQKGDTTAPGDEIAGGEDGSEKKDPQADPGNDITVTEEDAQKGMEEANNENDKKATTNTASPKLNAVARTTENPHAKSKHMQNGKTAKVTSLFGGQIKEKHKIRAVWDTAYINDLPDSAFAVIEPAYKEGKTDNKNARHLPYKDKDGQVDLAHLRNALARVNQLKPVTDSITKEELVAQASAKLNKLKEKYMKKDDSKKRSYGSIGGGDIGQLVVNNQDEYGVVVAYKVSDIDDKESCEITIQKFDGSLAVTNLPIAYWDEEEIEEEENGTQEPNEWYCASIGDAFLEMIEMCSNTMRKAKETKESDKPKESEDAEDTDNKDEEETDKDGEEEKNMKDSTRSAAEQKASDAAKDLQIQQQSEKLEKLQRMIKSPSAQGQPDFTDDVDTDDRKKNAAKPDQNVTDMFERAAISKELQRK